jgi:hypothetical protein
MVEFVGLIGASGLIELLVFSGLILIGFICAINAFVSALKLEPERRHLNNWIGLSWLEPALSVGFLMIAFNFFPSTRSHFEFSIMVIPGLSFCCFILPSIWFSSRDVNVQSIWQQLKFIVMARGVIVIFLVVSVLIETYFSRGFMVLQMASTFILAILIWSFYGLRKLSTLASRTIK